MSHLERFFIFRSSFVAILAILMLSNFAHASGPVSISGVVTTTDHRTRLGDEPVGLYADKEMSGGRLAFDYSASSQGDLSQPVPIGVYCLTYPNTGDDVNYLWVAYESQDQAAHPRCARCAQLSDEHPVRTAKASDLVILSKEKALATLDDTSNFIAAAIETSAVQIYTGANDLNSAKEALTHQTMSLRLNARQQGTLGSVLATVPKYFQDAIMTREKLLAIANSLLEAIKIFEQ